METYFPVAVSGAIRIAGGGTAWGGAPGDTAGFQERTSRLRELVAGMAESNTP
ncbi:hypothetical protein ACQUSR_02570 [Streptomyces sp. P1-3]|uniref:hypothetical protein n=1 Tax=Streptomyces sp. P1-3 TaxID=3421658 RepID=UPI003D36A78F